VICPRRLHLDGMPAPCRSRGQRHHPGRRQSQDACGGELLRREDDIEEALAVRFREYHAKTNPVLDIFRGKEYVITVDSRPPREQVQQAIRDKLGLPPSRLAAASSQVGARWRALAPIPILIASDSSTAVSIAGAVDAPAVHRLTLNGYMTFAASTRRQASPGSARTAGPGSKIA
jgi:hypothetical protein